MRGSHTSSAYLSAIVSSSWRSTRESMLPRPSSLYTILAFFFGASLVMSRCASASISIFLAIKRWNLPINHSGSRWTGWNSFSIQQSLILLILYFQVVGLDQFPTMAEHLGELNRIHVDLLITSLNLTFEMYPKLVGKPIEVFVEANLSHDLAAYIEKSVKEYYSRTKRGLSVMFVKQYDVKGRLLPGVLTRHKANLVSYFKRVLDEGRLFLCRRLATVAKAVEHKYNTGMGIGSSEPFPGESEVRDVVKNLVDQALLFRCYRRQNATIYSGKRSLNGMRAVDDMLMALITAVAWARLPQNSYVAE